MRNQWVGTPNGTKDILFDMNNRRRDLENRFLNYCQECGFREVRTPVLEYYDLFAKTGLPIEQENIQKIIDRSGRILVMRPDSTLPMARVAATQLAREPLPLKLFYVQPVFRSDIAHVGRSVEILQAGVECIGDSITDSDVIELAIGTLKALNVDNYTIELGHAALLPVLGRKFGLDDNDIDEVKNLIADKNFVALYSYLESFNNEKLPALFSAFIGLSGGKEIFNCLPSYLNDEEILHEFNPLLERFPSVKLDFGLISKMEYYTGILLRAYTPGAADAILTGGRYDSLLGHFSKNIPAIGFAVNLDAILNKYMNKGVNANAKRYQNGFNQGTS